MTSTRNSRTLILTLMMSLCGALSSVSVSADPLQRDRTLEQALRYEASADKTITPAKVIRWLFANSTSSAKPPSSTEFQPIVNVYNAKVRVIFALAYKF